MAQTLDQMAQFICSKVGQTDATSVALCYTFINFRYRMIYESFPWRDSQIILDDVSTISSVAYVALPAGIDRVISIRCNGVMLEPTNATLMIETNPTYLDTTGIPLYYEEYTDQTTDVKRIRLYPVPNNGAWTLKIVGKRTPNALTTSGHTPILRNIDNVLIAYAMGDMLERQRQYGKAQEKFKEAGALLEAAKQLEINQTNAPRSTKNITVTGDSLLEMTDAVCARCNTWAPEQRILVKDFIRRNYRRVHESNLWKDTLLNTTANTVNTQPYIAMPAGMQRVIAIALSTHERTLEPVDSLTLAQTDPGIFSRFGQPQYFEEYDSSGTTLIRLLPTPNEVLTLRITGKKTISTLSSDSDVIPIRNVANVIIDAACADMLGMLGEKERAAEFATSAQNGLKGAIDLEAQQTFRARITKPLTASGDSLSELADSVCDKCGIWSQEAVISAKHAVRRNYQRIYDAYLWPESKAIVSKNSNGSYVILPDHIAHVIKVRYSPDWPAIDVVDLSLYFELNPGIFEDTATQPVAYSVLTPVAVSALPNTAEALTFVSTSGNDKSNVFVRGETTDGLEVTETIALAGTTPVSSSNWYLTPLTVSKNITTGTVTVTGGTSGSVYQTLLPAEREKKHLRLWVQPTNPGVVSACLILGKRRIRPLQTDEDTPMIRGIGNALICSAAADLCRANGKTDVAAQYSAEAEKDIQSLINQFSQQAAYLQQVVPSVEPYGWDGADAEAWIVAKV